MRPGRQPHPDMQAYPDMRPHPDMRRGQRLGHDGPVSFDGFGPDVLAFYAQLEDDNSREFWTSHRQVYDDQVAAPLKELAAWLEPRFGAVKLFRPHRDVRFSKDKSPYKTEAGMAVSTMSMGLYAALNADGLFVAGGLWEASTDQARRLRAATADDRTGPPLTRVVNELRAAGWSVDGARLQRVPKPWDETHPRADLLHLKTLTGSRLNDPGSWLYTVEAAARLAEQWQSLGELSHWLDKHVGPPEHRRQTAAESAR